MDFDFGEENGLGCRILKRFWKKPDFIKIYANWILIISKDGCLTITNYEGTKTGTYDLEFSPSEEVSNILFPAEQHDNVFIWCTIASESCYFSYMPDYKGPITSVKTESTPTAIKVVAPNRLGCPALLLGFSDGCVYRVDIKLREDLRFENDAAGSAKPLAQRKTGPGPLTHPCVRVGLLAKGLAAASALDFWAARNFLLVGCTDSSYTIYDCAAARVLSTVGGSKNYPGVRKFISFTDCSSDWNFFAIRSSFRDSGTSGLPPVITWSRCLLRSDPKESPLIPACKIEFEAQGQFSHFHAHVVDSFAIERKQSLLGCIVKYIIEGVSSCYLLLFDCELLFASGTSNTITVLCSSDSMHVPGFLAFLHIRKVELLLDGPFHLDCALSCVDTVPLEMRSSCKIQSPFFHYFDFKITAFSDDVVKQVIVENQLVKCCKQIARLSDTIGHVAEYQIEDLLFANSCHGFDTVRSLIFNFLRLNQNSLLLTIDCDPQFQNTSLKHGLLSTVTDILNFTSNILLKSIILNQNSLEHESYYVGLLQKLYIYHKNRRNRDKVVTSWIKSLLLFTRLHTLLQPELKSSMGSGLAKFYTAAKSLFFGRERFIDSLLTVVNQRLSSASSQELPVPSCSYPPNSIHDVLGLVFIKSSSIPLTSAYIYYVLKDLHLFGLFSDRSLRMCASLLKLHKNWKNSVKSLWHLDRNNINKAIKFWSKISSMEQYRLFPCQNIYILARVLPDADKTLNISNLVFSALRSCTSISFLSILLRFLSKTGALEGLVELLPSIPLPVTAVLHCLWTEFATSRIRLLIHLRSNIKCQDFYLKLYHQIPDSVEYVRAIERMSVIPIELTAQGHYSESTNFIEKALVASKIGDRFSNRMKDFNWNFVQPCNLIHSVEMQLATVSKQRHPPPVSAERESVFAEASLKTGFEAIDVTFEPFSLTNYKEYTATIALFSNMKATVSKESEFHARSAYGKRKRKESTRMSPDISDKTKIQKKSPANKEIKARIKEDHHVLVSSSKIESFDADIHVESRHQTILEETEESASEALQPKFSAEQHTKAFDLGDSVSQISAVPLEELSAVSSTISRQPKPRSSRKKVQPPPQRQYNLRRLQNRSNASSVVSTSVSEIPLSYEVLPDDKPTKSAGRTKLKDRSKLMEEYLSGAQLRKLRPRTNNSTTAVNLTDYTEKSVATQSKKTRQKITTPAPSPRPKRTTRKTGR